MVHHYQYSTINSHHKVLVNLQASNMDAVKSTVTAVCPLVKIVFHACCNAVQEVVSIFCIPLIPVVTMIVQWK